MADHRQHDSGQALYYRHSLPIRLMHWFNAVILVILLMSGLNIFNAHPALNWGKQSDRGAPLLEVQALQSASGELIGVTRIAGHEFRTTGLLGVSRDRDGRIETIGFPSWLTIPGSRWLAMARRWHFLVAWLFALNLSCLLLYSFAGGHLRRDLLPTRNDLRSLPQTVAHHLLLRRHRGEAAKRYNVLQKFAYLAVIFGLLPLIALMGLGMSPALNAFPTGWVDLFGGRQSVRTIHFFVAWALVLFAVTHLFQITVNGFWNNLRSMITGNFKVGQEAGHE